VTIKIIAIDGPAGSGKSTLIKEIIDRGLARIPDHYSSLIRPRDYSSNKSQDNGASLSMIKNHEQLVDSLRTSYEHHHDVPIILDRFILSQFVYGTLRTSYGWRRKDLETYWNYELYQILNTFHQYKLRVKAGQTYSIPDIAIELWPVIFLPQKEIVKERRAKKSKEYYPFNLDREWNMYNRVFDFLDIGGVSTQGYTISLHKIQSYTSLVTLLKLVSL